MPHSPYKEAKDHLWVIYCQAAGMSDALDHQGLFGGLWNLQMTTFLALYQKELESAGCSVFSALPGQKMMSTCKHWLFKRCMWYSRWLFQPDMAGYLPPPTGSMIPSERPLYVLCHHHGLSSTYREGSWDFFLMQISSSKLSLWQFHLRVKEATYQADSIPQSQLARCTQGWSLGTASWHTS